MTRSGELLGRTRSPRGKWTRWSRAGTPAGAVDVAAVAARAGSHDVAIVDPDGRVWQRCQRGRGWSAWLDTGITDVVSLGAASSLSVGGHLWAADVEGRLHSRTIAGYGTWRDWARIDSPSRAVWVDGTRSPRGGPCRVAFSDPAGQTWSFDCADAAARWVRGF